MFEILFFLTSFLFFVWILRNVMFWIYLWQLKEYRLDRLRVHIFETEQGRSLLTNFSNVIKLALLFTYFIVIFYEDLTSYYYVLIFVVYLSSFLQVAAEVVNRKIRLPKLTLKSFSIFALTSVVLLIFYFFPLLDEFFWLVFLDKLVFFIIGLTILFFSIPTELYKEILIFRAVRKRIKYNNLLAVGITGSYGKGSTKEFTSAILSYKYNVLKTYGNQNTTIGVARTMVNNLNDRKEIFVAEMGAYKVGEVAEICYFVKPKVGILTGISDQHMSLFGGFDNIMKGKYELIESLPYNGLALFNGNSPCVLELASKTKKKKIVYYCAYDNKNWEKYGISALNIKTYRFHLVFDVYIKEKNEYIRSINVKLVGKQNIENLLPGLYLATYLKMNKKDIVKSFEKILPLSHAMEPYTNSNGTVLIDDTYNASYASFCAGLDYMKIYKGKKVLVFHPMIELGKNSEKDHYILGKKAGSILDNLILTNNSFFDVIKKGILSSGGNCILEVMNPADIIKFINTDFASGDVVVFEGKEAGLSLKSIEREKIY